MQLLLCPGCRMGWPQWLGKMGFRAPPQAQALYSWSWGKTYRFCARYWSSNFDIDQMPRETLSRKKKSCVQEAPGMNQCSWTSQRTVDFKMGQVFLSFMVILSCPYPLSWKYSLRLELRSHLIQMESQGRSITGLWTFTPPCQIHTLFWAHFLSPGPGIQYYISKMLSSACPSP